MLCIVLANPSSFSIFIISRAALHTVHGIVKSKWCQDVSRTCRWSKRYQEYILRFYWSHLITFWKSSPITVKLQRPAWWNCAKLRDMPPTCPNRSPSWHIRKENWSQWTKKSEIVVLFLQTFLAAHALICTAVMLHNELGPGEHCNRHPVLAIAGSPCMGMLTHLCYELAN